jgi:hypothetical protein
MPVPAMRPPARTDRIRSHERFDRRSPLE